MYSSPQLLSLPLIAGNKIIKHVLFSKVLIFKRSQLFPILVSELIDLIYQRVNLLILQRQLSIQYLKLSIFLRNSSMKIEKLCLGTLFDLLHGCGIVLEINVLSRLE